MLKPLREMDWHTLMALTAGKADPKLSIAMAFRDLADNAKRIGQLNITPDLLESLLSRTDGQGQREQPPAAPRK